MTPQPGSFGPGGADVVLRQDTFQALVPEIVLFLPRRRSY